MRNIHANVRTSFVCEVSKPVIDEGVYIHPMSVVIGAVILSKGVFVAPFVSVRCDEGGPIFVGEDANIQDGVVLHGLETTKGGVEIAGNSYEVEGKKYSVYIGKRASLAHQCHVHGPAVIGDDTFVGMQAMVWFSRVGRGCVIEPGAKVMGVEIADGRYVPMGDVVRTQAEADALPEITEDYIFANLNRGVVHVNVQLAAGYNKSGL